MAAVNLERRAGRGGPASNNVGQARPAGQSGLAAVCTDPAGRCGRDVLQAHALDADASTRR